jgi:hypothetical protein
MWFRTSRAVCVAAAIGFADVSVPKNAYCRNRGTTALSASCMARYIIVQPRAFGNGSVIAGFIANALSWVSWLQWITSVASVNSSGWWCTIGAA